MARSRTLQTTFSGGVLSPGFKGRTDLAHYYQGLSTGRNVLCRKEGGFTGRWGLDFIFDIGAPGILVEFRFNVEQIYVLIFVHQRIYFLRGDELVTNINGSGNDYLVSPWGVGDLYPGLDWDQMSDTMFLVHPEYAPRTLVRGAADNLWTLATPTFNNVPVFDFNDSASPTPTSHVATITFTSFSDGERYRLELNDFQTQELVYTANSTTANARRIHDALLALPVTGYSPSGIVVVFTTGTTYQVTFSGDSADTYEPMSGFNLDDPTGTISSAITTPGVPRREPVWSATRGYAQTVAFWEQRLVFGGVRELPATVFASQIGDYLNFGLGTGLDHEGVFINLNTQEHIRSLHRGRDLQLFTSGGEHYLSGTLLPVCAFPRQTPYGIPGGIAPTEVDGGTIFIDRHRKTVREYLFTWQEEAYKSNSLSVMASHLFNQITVVAAQTTTSDDEDSYVVALNADGSGAVLNTLRSQDVAAWSEIRTRAGDRLLYVATVGESFYFLVYRVIDGVERLFIEKQSASRMDCAKRVEATGTTIPGFDHLIGETVQVIVDGAPIDDLVVNESGELTLPHAATEYVEAGFFAPVLASTMPLLVDIGFGNMLGTKKRIAKIRLQVLNTLGLIVNGDRVPMQQPNITETDSPIPPFTGYIKVQDMGWTEGEALITIEQDQPLPLHVQALTAELDVGE